MREEGFYWVQWAPDKSDWEVGRFDGSAVRARDERLIVDERRIIRHDVDGMEERAEG